MNVSSTGNTYSTKASSSLGMSGLASGLDTDGMVEALLANAQSKIDKQEGLKQQTLWKQEIYRSLIAKINTFQSKYFSSTSSTNLLSQSFFNQMSAVTTASAFKATATSSAALGTTTLEVDRLATHSKLTGAAASGKLEGTLDEAQINKFLEQSDYKISFNVALDDNQKTITLDNAAIVGADGKVDSARLQAEIQKQLDKAHGTDQLKVTINNGAIGITTNDVKGRKVMVSGESNVLSAFGYQNGQSNRIGMGGTLAQNYFNVPLDGNTFKFTINGVDLEFDKTATVTEVMNGINNSDAGVRMTYRALDDKFSLEATDSGAGHAITFSDTTGNLMAAMFGAPSSDNTGDDGGYVYNEGVNALVKIDGVETQRSSNSFAVNGINIELKAVTTTEETIGVSRDTDSVIAGIKSFMEDYNALIDELNGLIREDSTYKKYAPLTDAQKKEMSEREIELWEEKAKQGLLRGDSAVSTFLQSMRTALYEKPEGSLYSIFDIGIETSSEWKDYGKLVFSTDGEAKLRQVLDSNPNDVIKLFADAKEGLSVKMESILKYTANTSSASRGTLVQIAGVENAASDYDNDLYDRLQLIERRIDQLKAAYQKEKTRYWRQFNAMESVISNMNTQSSWLAQQLSV